jgi:tripartite-type tricarboxylate transporter receptor subunit TctC
VPRLHLLSVVVSCLLLSLACSSSAPASSPPATAKPTALASSSPASNGVAAASPASKPAASPAIASPAAALPAVNSEEAARYFAGKSITVTVGYAPGGGFDTFARILAVHMPRFIPGNPNMIVTNVPGADSLVAAQALQRKAPGNGLDIGVFTLGLIPRSLLGEKLEGFDPAGFDYLGMPDSAPNESMVCSRTAVANSLDAFMQGGRRLKIGSTGGVGNVPLMMEWAVLAGFPIEIVSGYGGTSEASQAFDRGELELNGFCDASTSSRYPHWFGTEQFATPLFYFSQKPKFMEPMLSQGKYPWFRQAFDVVNVTSAQRRALEAHISFGGSRVFALPARTPENVAAALQRAFAETVNDPTVQADLLQRNYEVGLLSGTDMQRTIREFADQPPDVLEVLRRMYKIGS